MRSTRIFYLVGLLYLLSGVAEAESIVCDGVLGNSGERGPWLVRGDASNNGRIGIGVVYDRHGTLWHRCSSHGLSRFSPDGRLLGHFRLPNGHEGTSGVLTHAGNEIVALLNGVGMFAVSTDAAPGSDVRPLKYDGIKAISYGSRDGKLAAVDKNEQLLLLKISDASAERLVAVPGGYAVEMTPDGAIYVFRFDGRQHGNVHRYVNSVEDADSWPRRYNYFQAVGNNLFTYGYHTTIGRFSADFQPVPGVVLGGASGSVISFLPWDEEAHLPVGMALMGKNLYALSSLSGSLHILRWEPEWKKFAFVRRIGTISSCGGLALDRAGNVRCGAGCWRWDDMPDTPHRYSGFPLFVPAAMSEEDKILTLFTLNRRPMYSRGLINDYPHLMDLSTPLDALKDVAGTVTYRSGKDQLVLSVNSKGEGHTIRTGPQEDFAGMGPPVTLRTAPPVKKWTALARKSDASLVGAADGELIELMPDGGNWKETRRWKSWGNLPEQKFGRQIIVAFDDGRLWVTDRERHRVLCFSSDGKKLLASFGKMDVAGDDLEHLNEPDKIAVRGNRAIVFDSSNQRLVKLRFR